MDTQTNAVIRVVCLCLKFCLDLDQAAACISRDEHRFLAFSQIEYRFRKLISLLFVLINYARDQTVPHKDARTRKPKRDYTTGKFT